MSQTSTSAAGVTGVRRGSLKIAPGILTAVSINTEPVAHTLGLQFWYGLLAHGPKPEDGVLDTLVAGYISWPVGLAWHGFLEIPEGIFLIVEGVSSFDIETDATITDTRVTLAVDGALTQYLLKVNGVT